MKKLSAIVSITLLAMTGIVLVYLEALSTDLPCMQAENWCDDCQGSFSLVDCWDYGAHRYCYFYCFFSGDCWHWSGYSSPVYEVCTYY
jgi:hypothetical protein